MPIVWYNVGCMGTKTSEKRSISPNNVWVGALPKLHEIGVQDSTRNVGEDNPREAENKTRTFKSHLMNWVEKGDGVVVGAQVKTESVPLRLPALSGKRIIMHGTSVVYNTFGVIVSPSGEHDLPTQRDSSETQLFINASTMDPRSWGEIQDIREGLRASRDNVLLATRLSMGQRQIALTVHERALARVHDVRNESIEVMPRDCYWNPMGAGHLEIVPPSHGVVICRDAGNTYQAFSRVRGLDNQPHDLPIDLERLVADNVVELPGKSFKRDFSRFIHEVIDTSRRKLASG